MPRSAEEFYIPYPVLVVTTVLFWGLPSPGQMEKHNLLDLDIWS